MIIKPTSSTDYEIYVEVDAETSTGETVKVLQKRGITSVALQELKIKNIEEQITRLNTQLADEQEILTNIKNGGNE